MHTIIEPDSRSVQDLASAPQYDNDYLAWLSWQVNLLRERKFAQLDLDALIRDLESVLAQTRSALRGRCRVLIMNLLKCQFQPERRSRSWLRTIDTQRHRIDDLLNDSPSLRHSLPEVAEQCYSRARLQAMKETGLDKSVLPSALPYSLEQLFDDDFYAQA